MIARRKFRSEPAKKRERIKLAFRIVLVFVGLGAFGALFFAGVRLDQLRIQHIYIHSNGVLDRSQIASAIESNFSSHYLGLFPKNSIFVLSHSELENTIQSEFPRIENVTFKRSGPWTIGVEVTEREPDALWCGDVTPPIAEEKTTEHARDNSTLWGTCYYMDKNSYIYSKAPLYTGNVFARYYGSLERAEPIGQHFINPDVYARWQGFYESFIFKEIVPQAVLFLDERDIELYLSNGLKVFIPIAEDVDLAKRRLFSILESDTVDYTKTVDYIDLRFGKKAFVKYTEGVYDAP